MELFLLVVLLILVIVGNNRFSAVKEAVNLQNTIINQLRAELLAFQKEFRSPVTEPPPAQQPIEPISEPTPVITVVPPAPPILEPEPILVESVVPEPVIEPAAAPVQPLSPQPLIRSEPKPSFLQRFLAENPDLEKFIGENLINKIGIAILVAGIGYFVKFAIDQNWINEIGRVLIGILAGGLLLGVAHRLRNTFTAFSSVLVAGGLSVLYFTIAIAFSDYKIFSQTAAFLLMVVITGFAVLLAIAYNRSALAVMSLIGGFATPFMVSTGHSNYVVLFSYLLVLDCGMLVLAYFKKWNIVHFVAYGFTVLLYSLWLSTEVLGVKQGPYSGALLFASLFYVVFMAMNLIYNLKHQAKFLAIEISLLLSTTAFYYAAGMIILANVNHGAYQGLFTAGLAVVNFGIATLLYRQGTVDRTLIYLLIGLVVTFASLTVPIQLDGNFITMFWALEAVLLLWLSQRSGLTLLATGAVIVMGLMLISLTMDWSALYRDAYTPPFLHIVFNKAFVTSLIAIASLALTQRLLRNQASPFQFWLGQLNVSTYQRIIGYLMVIVTYFAGVCELDYQASHAFGFGANRTIFLGTYNLLFAAGLLLIARRSALRSRLLQTSVLGVILLLLYVTFFDPAVHDLLGAYFQGQDTSLIGFPIHYLSLACVLGLLVLLHTIRPQLDPLPAVFGKIWPWFLGFILVYTASSELYSHVVYFTFSGADLPTSTNQKLDVATRYYALLEQINKVGLPILWGVCAFAFMYVGLNRRNRQFRIISLSLFALTLLKLFFYDLQGISEGGRIAAFISLGALLLIISFMYQRIKRLILDTDTPQSAPEEL
ncbi:DUF2339 domain-containing protein [Spirosoma sp. KCTC 42546]|uniref:DUF2339 domain-containing protein n=1 Tax=Spirosoma sp. KCTC 42546 TaxID=2520506 RepID=UPI001157B9C2|nr:DUF2339 domain-containing protein [Spirosoma sp. KCTC 42546]QDK78978.1 DUF2339 domain-containing protein [Spirosoma sp. KCTC 42546]